MQPWFQKIGKLGVHQGRNLPLSLAFLARLKRSLKSRKTENPILQLRHNHYLVNLALFVVCCFSPTVNETYFLVRNLAVTWDLLLYPCFCINNGYLNQRKLFFQMRRSYVANRRKAYLKSIWNYKDKS